MRKLIALLLALLLALSITACGNKPADGGASTSSAANSSTENGLPAGNATVSTTASRTTTSGRTPPSTSQVTTTTTAPTETKTWYTKGGASITKAEVDAIMAQTYVKPKNVIVMIADGMGPNDITLAEEHADGVYDFGLVLNQIKNHGLATTHSANADVTDSAASGTALSTGVKTNNGYIGKDVDGNDLVTMAEIARAAGKKVGIITDEVISGATPTAFTVHNISRSNTAELINSMIKFKE